MSSSRASTSPLADQLVSACWNGDLLAAQAAVAGGARVNEKGATPEGAAWLPLAAAINQQHHDVVVWLLSHRANPNGDWVMHWGAYTSTAAILQLLLDARGDVNGKSEGEPPLADPPLFPAVRGNNSEDKVRVLLAQPSLDLTITYYGYTPEKFALDGHRPAVADMIVAEVSRMGLLVARRRVW